ncbi:MAG: bacteriohemerythrin [Sulfurimicrobium sp.]|nr:bacteriohemerythrin [Sulfurimicrobium sp.]MDP1703485.1 bacteriohemerythrin [Sulfurimicrobium sp.]MDP2199119.1 bacteriohemerythrin [Sulfurimicrobium sp.]
MDDKTFFVWSDTMNTGIMEIDDQHKMLVGILNRLFHAVVQRENNEITIEILDTLVDYTKTHFGLEEKLLQDAGYNPTEFAAHQQEHRAFIEKISNAANKHLVEGKSVSFEIINFLKHWLQEHILITDKKYAEALKSAGYCSKDWTNFANNAMANKQQTTPKQKHWWKLW